jgi:hypothetical protein
LITNSRNLALIASESPDITKKRLIRSGLMAVNETTIFDYRQDTWLGKAAPDHAQEWLASGVDPGIVSLNVETLIDTATQPHSDSLFPIAERLNWKLTRFGQARSALRGWWVSGIDPFTWEPMTWGRFKPDANTPVFDREKSKPAKYLSPSLGPGSSRLILLQVPDSIWQRVAERHGQQLPADRSQGFWHWVWQQRLPVILTEGEKKAGCLLSLGHAAIALPGIFSGYRKSTGKLIPELEVFADRKRTISICFDFETRSVPLKHLNLAITKLGQLLQANGAVVQVIALPGPEKGVDDFVVAQGEDGFEQLEQAAQPLGLWQSQQLWSLTYPPALVLNQPYLGDLSYPDSGLVCIKSAKGSGKTTALQGLIRQASQTGRKALVITHRIQLGRAICHSIGIDWIEDLHQSETEGLLGYGLCIDSLHPTSQARFDPQAWKGAIVILDEVEQVLWHALNSLTCYDHRVKILETLRELVQVVLSSGGLLIAQDADLSDVSISYLTGLTEQPIVPWLITNQWQPEHNWQVSIYHTPNPAPLVARLTATLESGAVFIALDSQKVQGRWSSKNLERYLQQRFPTKRILRIDSETVADPEHAAYGIVEHLNQQITCYDIVLATPTIGTGVSIDVQGHFQAVFGIFQGVIPDAEARQALARVREPIPRYVWAAPFGPGKVGNGSCSYQDVITSTTRLVKYNIALLKEIDFDVDQQTDPITLRTWAKMAARVNTSLWSYRQQLNQGLQNEGHQLTVVTTDLTEILTATLKDNPNQPAEQLAQHLSQGRLQIPGYEFLEQQHTKSETTSVLVGMAQVKQDYQEQEAKAVSSAEAIAKPDYETLKEQRAKTWEERCAIRKYELQRRYAMPVTAELKLKDDQGWFNQLRLHYYLSQDVLLVHQRDYKEWQGHLNRGEGKVALQDVRLLTAQVEALKGLGILHLLNPEREIRAADTDIQQIAQYCIAYSQDIKTLFNLTISERMTPIEIVQALLSKLALKLTCIRRDQANDGRRGGVRVYQYCPPNDQRELIFAQWQQRDSALISASKAQDHAETNQDDQTISNARIGLATVDDPPPDISKLDQSEVGSITRKPPIPELQPCASGLNQVLAQTSSPANTQSRISIGSVVQVATQTDNWLVVELKSTAAKLRSLSNETECIQPLAALMPAQIPAVRVQFASYSSA